MPALFDSIRAAANDERVVISDHADERLRERGIVVWQVVTGLADGRLLLERPDTTPFPSVEVHQVLADGTPVKAVWSYIARENVAVLITVHFFDR